jgi:hemerythrin-like domain-containing protein
LFGDHGEIGIELDELDFIMGEGDINYGNLTRTFWKVCRLWDDHERMEEELFEVMKREGFEIPVEVITVEHVAIRERKDAVERAIGSGSEARVRESFVSDLRELVDIIRAHMEIEEEVLSSVVVEYFSEDGLAEMVGIVGKWRS